MRPIEVLSIIALTATIDIYAFNIESHISAGYSLDNISFSIQGSELDENLNPKIPIKYESKFNGIKSASTNCDFLFNQKDYIFNIGFSLGSILSGENYNSSYEEANREGIYNKTLDNSNSGKISSINTYIGYKIKKDSIKFIPKVGYYFNNQNIDMKNIKVLEPIDYYEVNGNQTIQDANYNAKWFGPFIGFNIIRDINSKFIFDISLIYHLENKYKSSIDWYIKDGFMHPKSFTHEANAKGIEASSKIEYNFKSINIFLEYRYFDFLIKSNEESIEKSYLDNKSINSATLNSVKWDSGLLKIGLNKKF